MLMLSKRWSVEVTFEPELDSYPNIIEVHRFCPGWGARRFCNRAVATGQDAKVMPPLDWFYSVVAKWEPAEALDELTEAVRILRRKGVTASELRAREAVEVTQVQQVRRMVQEEVAKLEDSDATKRGIIPIRRGTGPERLGERIAADPKAVARAQAEEFTSVDAAA